MSPRPADDPLLDLLPSIRGGPLTCLWALGRVGGARQARWLCRVTGYSAGTVTQALQVLVEAGLVERVHGRGGWRSTFRLAFLPRGSGDRAASSSLKYLNKLSAEEGVPDCRQDRKNPAFLKKSLALRGRRNKDGIPAERRNRGALVDAPAHKDGLVGGYPAKELPADASVRQALRNGGIGEPKASYLAGLPYVTAEYVCAMHSKTRRLRQDVRLLIYRIQQHDPMPERCPGGMCAECVLDRGGDREWGRSYPTLADAPEQPEAQAKAAPTPHDPSLDLPAAQGTSHSLMDAWRIGVELVVGLRPSARGLETLRGCRPLRFEPQGDYLVVLAADASARDWLQDSLATLLSRQIVGVTCRRLAIRFVAPGDEASSQGEH
jgi:DNA-binding transcriptional ArsR family regulator